MAANATTTGPSLAELEKESRMGGYGTETAGREIRVIDISDFETRRAEITEQLWSAAVDIGFFQISGHGLSSEDISDIFSASKSFFDLPEDVKGRHSLKQGLNAGWESRSQVRPSTGTPDQKESFQVTLPHMDGLWVSEDELPGFRAKMLGFESRCHAVAMRVLSCFADKLGLDREFFSRAHDRASPQYQSTLRALHYMELPEGAPEEDPVTGRPLWRAGAHTDYDCLTLLFQRPGQGGLQVCPGREMQGQAWTPVPPVADAITCNIGDMLMRWSDDRLPSNFHRVKMPSKDEYRGPRYSVAYFAQANKDVLIETPKGSYEPLTAGEYLLRRINANFAELEKKKKQDVAAPAPEPVAA